MNTFQRPVTISYEQEESLAFDTALEIEIDLGIDPARVHQTTALVLAAIKCCNEGRPRLCSQ